MINKKYRVSFVTLGCRVNQYESDAISAALGEIGFETVSSSEKADLAIINTCTVTAESDRKSRQMIRRAKKNASHVIVTGCFAEVSPEAAREIGGISAIIGNRNKSEVIRISRELCEGTFNEKAVESDFEACDALCGGTASRARAYIKIEDGCENRCAYCIIPKARGPVRSKSPGAVIAEVKTLAGAGVREIILAGIETASYGRDFSGEYSLLDLLEEVSRVDGIERIRMGSLDPSSMRGDFPKRIAMLPKVMPHFHISLQSGCSRTLAAMRRRYNANQAQEFIENVRKYVPDVMLSADIIAGFPGETDEDFQESAEFLRRARLLHIHAFPYSIRQGTEAEKMNCQLPEDIKKARVAELCNIDRAVRLELLEDYVRVHGDMPVHVLCETWENGIGRGHSEHYVEVEFECARDVCGKICEVYLRDIEGDMCRGVM